MQTALFRTRKFKDRTFMTPVAYLASLILLLLLSSIIVVFGVVEMWIAVTGQSEKYHVNMVESPPAWSQETSEDALTPRLYNGIRGVVIFSWGATTVAYTLGLVGATGFGIPLGVTVLLYGGFALGNGMYASPS